ncbi:MAG TPA: hypothetical protein VD837_08870 [Terriglobales bacterium]|nr:hypothetical protein [Terriglobales bacterium]
MLAGFFDVLFGCSHKRYSFPITAKPGPRRSEAASVTGTYVVCLDCGREFAYDWARMKVITAPGENIGKTAETTAVQAKAA